MNTDGIPRVALKTDYLMYISRENEALTICRWTQLKMLHEWKWTVATSLDAHT
jgi:hypothetical protein